MEPGQLQGTSLRWPQSITGHETILVVDDEAAVRRLMTRVLATGGYRTFEASTADEAVAVLERHGSEIQLLLTDVGLPGMSGLRLAETAQPRWPHVKVLLMSGYDRTAADREKGTPWASMQKPFTPKDVLSRIRVVLDEPQLTR